MSRTYYDILEVDKDASSVEIKKAYRALALKHHPDMHAGDPVQEELFKEITEAYGVLIDPDKRRSYDRSRITGISREQVFEDIFAHQEYSDVFNDMPIKKEWVEKILDIGKVFAYEALVYGGRPRDIMRRSMVRLASQNASKAFHNVMDIHENIAIPTDLARKGGSITVSYKPGFSSRTIKVKVPCNLQTGTILRIPGMGRSNFRKTSGDLYLHVQIAAS